MIAQRQIARPLGSTLCAASRTRLFFFRWHVRPPERKPYIRPPARPRSPNRRGASRASANCTAVFAVAIRLAATGAGRQAIAAQYQPRCLRAILVLRCPRRKTAYRESRCVENDITHVGARERLRDSLAQSDALTARKIHGAPWLARPIITPSAPVKSSTSRAFCGVSMSPLAKTGMRTRDLMSRIVSYSASPA